MLAATVSDRASLGQTEKSSAARPGATFAELPKAVILRPVILVSKIIDPDDTVEVGDFVFGTTIAGTTTYSTVPIHPALHHANIGTSWLAADGVTEFHFDGIWVVTEVADGKAHLTVSPTSTVNCTVYGWCTGHDVSLLAEPGDPNDQMSDYMLLAEHWADETRFFEFPDAQDDRDFVTIGPMDHRGIPMVNVQVKHDRALTADGVEAFASQLEALAAKLRFEAPTILASVVS